MLVSRRVFSGCAVDVRGLATWGAALGDVTQNLKVRAVAFDLDAVINAEALADPHKRYAVGKSTDPTTSIVAAIPVKEVDADGNKLDPRSKYAEKMKMKLARHNLENPTHSPQKHSLKGTAARWIITEGMGDVMDYLHNRSMKLAFLGGREVHPRHLELLLEQMEPSKLSYLRPDFLTKMKVEAWVEYSLIEMEVAVEQAKSSIFVVSSNDLTLAAAKKRGHFTCRFRPPNALFGQVSTDFVAASAMEVRDALNELTGVPLRESVLLNNFEGPKHRTTR